MKKDKCLGILEIVFSLIGVVMIVVAIIIGVNAVNKKKSYLPVDATITEIDSYRDSDGDVSYKVYVSYRVKGKWYDNVSLGYYSSSMDVDDVIEVFYNPENPGKITSLTGMWIGAGICGLMGIVFFCVGGGITIGNFLKNKRYKELIEGGRYCMATIDSIDWNRNYTVNGQHPYVIYCSCHDEYSDIIYKYKSDNIWYDPSPILETRGITELKVYIDRNDPKKYYVDISVIEDKVVDLT